MDAASDVPKGPILENVYKSECLEQSEYKENESNLDNVIIMPESRTSSCARQIADTQKIDGQELFHDVSSSLFSKSTEVPCVDKMTDEIFHDAEFIDVNSCEVGDSITFEENVDSLPFRFDEMCNTSVVENILAKHDNLNKEISCDGSDSGVEVCGGAEIGPALQRVFSYNSGGYASSCGGIEDYNTVTLSCDSSLISCYSDDVTSATIVLPPHTGDGTSEAGSESSSVTGKDISVRKSRKAADTISAKRKEFSQREKVSSASKSKNTSVTAASSCKSRSLTPRTVSSGRSSDKTPAKQDSVVANKREKTKATPSTNCSVSKTVTNKINQSVSNCKSSRPNSAPVTRATKPAGVVENIKKDSTAKTRSSSRTASSTRGKITNDDGRWPSINTKSQSATPRVKPDMQQPQHSKPAAIMVNSIGSCANALLMESKATALEKYATLPRRKRNVSPETVAVDSHSRNHSTTRDPSLNRAASLRKQHTREGVQSVKSLPPYPRRHSHHKIRIYHETTVQTVLTGSDVENALAGVTLKERVPVDAAETKDQAIQVDCRDTQIELLEAKIMELTEKNASLLADYEKNCSELQAVKDQLDEEKKSKQEAEEGRKQIINDVRAIFTSINMGQEVSESMDCLKNLEEHVLSCTNTLIKQQQRIDELQCACKTLNRDLEKSLAAQKTLLHQQQELEAEYQELQEFLQAEKSTLAEALQEAENEIEKQKQETAQCNVELDRRQEECKHLVRIAEQRRQENLALQVKLNALEQRSRDLLLQQGAAVSGAAVALSGLGSRLDSLIEQLVASYDISEKDLEDVIFHNEAYSKSNSSIEASPEKSSSSRSSEHVVLSKQLTPSPKRGASFVSAVINAIRNAAAQSPFSNMQEKAIIPESKSTELSSPTSVPSVSTPEGDNLIDLERAPSDQDIPDVEESNCDNSVSRLVNSESLQNLSQAILTRQHLELAEADMSTPKSQDTEMFSPLDDYPPALTLVDQVIDVDNLITKLLKVLRIIQLESDTCIEELHDERVHLAEQVRREQENRREVQDELKNWEKVSSQLRCELQEARQQLNRRVQELEDTRRELQSQRVQVESLNHDLIATTSAYQQIQAKYHHREQEAEATLKHWKRTGELPSQEVLARIICAREEMPILKEKLAEKEKQLNEMNQKFVVNKQLLSENWQQAVSEVRRQYEAIDAALETLQNVQSIVIKCPPLAKLQQDLEESNFRCASSLPLMASDLNANAALLSLSNGSSNGIDITPTPPAHNHVNGKV